MVLDWVDGALLDPVDGVGKVLDGELSNVLVLEVLWSLESVHSLGLELGHGREHVVLKDERVLGGVDLLDLSVLLGEETHSEVVFLLGSVVESPLLDVLHEGLLDLEGDWGFAGEDTGVNTEGADHLHE